MERGVPFSLEAALSGTVLVTSTFHKPAAHPLAGELAQKLRARGVKVSLDLDFEVAGKVLGSALALGFQGLADRMVDDFCREADRA